MFTISVEEERRGTVPSREFFSAARLESPLTMHPDFDSRPSKNPFDRFPVLAYRIECGEEVEEWFLVFEFDLVNDNLGPRTAPPRRSEADARARLTELGLEASDVDARIDWARRWMATRIMKSKEQSVLWLPPL